MYCNDCKTDFGEDKDHEIYVAVRRLIDIVEKRELPTISQLLSNNIMEKLLRCCKEPQFYWGEQGENDA